MSDCARRVSGIVALGTLLITAGGPAAATPTDTPTATHTNTPTVAPTASPTATHTPSLLCGATPVPSGCGQAVKSTFSLKQSAQTINKNKLAWRWIKLPADYVSAFGEPLTTTAYGLCVYDWSGGMPALVMSAAVPPGGTCAGGKPCWKEMGNDVPRGFRYWDRGRTRDGIVQLVLKANEGEKKAKILLVGRGQQLPVPPPASGRWMFSQDSYVTVQLVNSAGGCWQANYSAAAIRNRTDLFRDKCGTSKQGPCS